MAQIGAVLVSFRPDAADHITASREHRPNAVPSLGAAR
jgi:hypothetical protein